MDFGIKLLRFNEEILRKCLNKKPRFKRGFFIWLKLKLKFLLFNFCFLSGKLTEVENSGSTNNTSLVHLDCMNVRRIERNDTFYAHVTRHFSNRKSLGSSCSLNLDNNTFENLNTFFVSFFNFVVYANGITVLNEGISIAFS